MIKEEIGTVTQKEFFKELKIVIPEMKLYDRPYVYNTFGLLLSFTRETIKLSHKNRIQRAKSGQEDIFYRIGFFLNKCWFQGTYDVMNAVMVSYFENIDKNTYAVIRPYLAISLDKEVKRYIKWWHSKKKLSKS